MVVLLCKLFVFFFFKQKTAYQMRISDCGSDVCSSDLDFHVITGGPGSGKSTLIEALAVEGFDHRPEAGRAIIRDQVAIGGAALPWADRAAFAELMLGWELRSWHEAHDRAGPVICDRSVPDVAGYLRLCGLPVPAHVSQAADLFRYQPRVFIAPLARDIRGRCGKNTGFRGSAGDLSGDGRGDRKSTRLNSSH